MSAQPRALLHILDTVYDGPHIPEAGDDAVVCLDYQVGIFSSVRQLVVGIESQGAARAVERTFWAVERGFRDDLPKVLQAHPQAGESARIGLHTNRRLLPTVVIDEPDANDASDFRGQIIFHIVVYGGNR